MGDRPHRDAELIPNLYNFVRDTVDDVVANLIVIPNGVAVPIDGSVDANALQHPPPLGFLRCTLEGLQAARPLPPVYVEVLLGARTWRSATQARPQWQEGNVEDLWVHSHDQLLRLRVFASHTFGTQLLACGQVHVRDLQPGRIEVPLTAPGPHVPNGPGAQGVEDQAESFSAELHLEWLPLLDSVQGEALLASVHLDHLKGLRFEHHRLRVTLLDSSHESVGHSGLQHLEDERHGTRLLGPGTGG